MGSLAERVQLKMIELGINQEKLAKLSNTSQTTISNVLSGTTKNPRNVICLANALGVDPMWLQTGATVSISGKNQISNSSITATVNNSAGNGQDIALAQEEPDDEHNHRLDYLDVRAAAGMTMEFQSSDYPEIIRSIWLSDEGMRELVGRSNTKGLSIIIVPTDSMEPTIKKGGLVVIDTNIKTYTGEGIYAFSINGNLFIKRLQKRLKGGYIVISDNDKKYQPEEMDNELMDNAVFVGKFVRCWNIETVDL